MKKIVLQAAASVLITLTVATMLASCKQADVVTFSDEPLTTVTPSATVRPTPSPTATPEPTVEPTETPEPTPEVYSGATNLLTGLPIDDASAKLRPAAIMINNIKEALPMFGLNKADMIYEVLAEGGVTRLLAVYQNPKDAGEVGSVRSSRHYFLDLAQGLDAVYVHAGGSPQAYSEFKKRGMDHLDGVTTVYDFFYRNSKRSSYAFEHRLFLKGDKLAEYLNSNTKMRREHADDYAAPLKFTDDGTPANGSATAKISVHYSNYKIGVFEYSADSGKFKVSEYGKAMNDGADSKQVEVTNVLILKVAVAKISGDTYGRLNVTLTGDGDGWYACGGKYVEITWSKKSATDPFVYKLAGTDTVVEFGRGTTYINVVPKTEKVTFE